MGTYETVGQFTQNTVGLDQVKSAQQLYMQTEAVRFRFCRIGGCWPQNIRTTSERNPAIKSAQTQHHGKIQHQNKGPLEPSQKIPCSCLRKRAAVCGLSLCDLNIQAALKTGLGEPWENCERLNTTYQRSMRLAPRRKCRVGLVAPAKLASGRLPAATTPQPGPPSPHITTNNMQVCLALPPELCAKQAP